MKDALRETVTIREGDRFDDEITLPLRIICERKPETAAANRREQRKASSRDRRNLKNPFAPA